MRLFISWSGPVSQQIAQEIRRWLPLILPSVEPFITTTDIEKGARWQGEISRELEGCNYGIVCLAADNLKSPWLTFEAGALSKQLAGRVSTILFGIKHSDVQLPLSMFQGTLFNENEMRQLVMSINSSTTSEQYRDESQIDTLFPAIWGKLHEPVKLILQNAGALSPESAPAAPKLESLALEMMALLRQQNSVLASPEKLLDPIMTVLEDKLSQIFSRRDYKLLDQIEELFNSQIIAKDRKFYMKDGRIKITLGEASEKEKLFPAPRVSEKE